MKNYFKTKDFKFFKALIVKAGDTAHDLQKKGLDIKRKSDRSIVTQADLLVQDLLIDKIAKKYSGINFIHEENFNISTNNIEESTITAIIDPIDGTAVFSMHLPTWCVSIGIFSGYTPLYGFVYSPGLGMLFYNDNENSYLNENVLTIKKNIEIDNESNIFFASDIRSVLNISFPGKIRNLGSTALHACLTADNRRNRSIAFIGKSNLWDWAGAVPIVLKAGVNLRYFNGEKIDFEEIIKNRYSLPDYLIAYNSDDFEAIKNIFKEISS